MTMTYTVVDSGKRQSFASGMVRDTADDKTQYIRVFDGPMLKRWAEHLTKGAAKYPDVQPGKPNWMLATGKAEAERFRASAARHFAQWLAGETDEDHAAALFFNVNGYEYVQLRRGPFKFNYSGVTLRLGSGSTPMSDTPLQQEPPPACSICGSYAHFAAKSEK